MKVFRELQKIVKSLWGNEQVRDVAENYILSRVTDKYIEKNKINPPDIKDILLKSIIDRAVKSIKDQWLIALELDSANGGLNNNASRVIIKLANNKAIKERIFDEIKNSMFIK